MPHQIERQISYAELKGLIKTTVAAAQQCIYTGQKFLHCEGLREIVVSSNIETCHTIFYRSTRGEHQYRCHDVFSSHLAADLDPVDTRQHHVKDHCIVGIAQSQVKTCVPIVRQVYGVPLFQ